MFSKIFNKKNKQEYEFKIKGFTCQGCVKTATNFLTKQKGVYDVKIDLDNGTAKITVSPELWNENKLKEKIKEIGYEFI